MKPTRHPRTAEQGLHSDRQHNRPSGPQHVEINFLPHSDWTIEVGIPVALIKSRRNHHKPVALPALRVLGLAPIELVIAAACAKRRQQQQRALFANFESLL